MDLGQLWNNLLAANMLNLNMEGACTFPGYFMQQLHLYANLNNSLNSPTPTDASFVSSVSSDISEATISEDSQANTEEDDTKSCKNHEIQFCDNETVEKTRRRIQRRRYSREEYKCKTCSYMCTTEKAFFNHLKQDCELSMNKEGCPKVSCPICGKDRDSETLILNHMTKHRIGKYFCCDLCKFRTLQMKKLIQHRRMHTGEKPHLCPFCSYRSARRDNLRSHVRRVHKKDNLTCDTFIPDTMLLLPSHTNNSVNNAILNA